MVYKLGQSAPRNFQRLNGAQQIKDVVAGIICQEGKAKISRLNILCPQHLTVAQKPLGFTAFACFHTDV